MCIECSGKKTVYHFAVLKFAYTPYKSIFLNKFYFQDILAVLY